MFSVNADVVARAPTFSLFNVTNGEDEAITILDQTDVPEGMAQGSGFALVPSVDGTKMILAFYPSEASWQGKFLYGKNHLKLVANDAANPRFALV